MTRPKILHVGGTLYWVIRTRNPDTMVLKDADSTPTVAVRKNGASTADSVTVTKRSATTGIYDCSYNPAGEVEGDEFTIEESATVTGTTTGSATYTNSWEFTVIAVERGTDGGATSAQALDIQSRIPTTLDSGNMRSSVQSMAANTLTASALASDAVAEIAAAAGGSVTVAPLQATAPNRVAGTQVVTYINDTSDIGPIAVSDSNGDAVDLSAYTLKVCIEQRDGTVLQNATPTVSGTGNNQITWTPNASSVATTDYKRWSLRVVSTGQVLALGDFIVDPAAKIST